MANNVSRGKRCCGYLINLFCCATIIGFIIQVIFGIKNEKLIGQRFAGTFQPTGRLNVLLFGLVYVVVFGSGILALINFILWILDKPGIVTGLFDR